MTAKSHFNQRCKERGIVNTDIDDLFQRLRFAAQNGRDDLIEKVLEHDGGAFYRFRCEDGIFYAYMVNCYPVTIYTQKMMRAAKFARKRRAGRGGRRINGGT